MRRRPWIMVDGKSARWRWTKLHLGVARAIFFRTHLHRAIGQLHALRDEFGESDFCAAYEGKFLLQAGDPAAARNAYADVFENVRGRTDDVGRFIRYVAEGWMALIDGKNPALAERCFAHAADIPVRAIFKAANPGPWSNRPDKFDREFETWMRRHYPNE